MTKTNINIKAFSEETKLKLDIFRRCFREWYPVFINQNKIRLYIYDLFAGSGTDVDGTPGSPLILLEESKGSENEYCKFLQTKPNKFVSFTFNDSDKKKLSELKNKVEENIANCQNNCSLLCPFQINYKNEDFENLMEDPNIKNILKNPNIGKFILLDQYGFKEITESIFYLLVESPKTDFIFFIASSYVKRFAEKPVVTKYFKKKKLKFDDSKPKECHQIIGKYYKDLIPEGKKYYIHTFTLQKGSNYYGLIFGTAHSLGMEKFVKVCWQVDKLAGESNCNINDDFEEDTLFHNQNKTTKKQKISDQIRSKILNGEIKNNQEGLDFALTQGCEPKLFVDVVESLKKENKISIIGNFNKQSTKIHKVSKYSIICNENN